MNNHAHIFQINASNGGVPKQSIRIGHVTELGLTVDRQNNTDHHGGPNRALCLFSLERILELQAEGHQIYPGSTGENVTIAGLDWTEVRPGTQLHLGQVVVEVTGFAAPCKKIRHSFVAENFNRISAKKHPGWARAYVRVLQTGQIHIGESITLKQLDDSPNH